MPIQTIKTNILLSGALGRVGQLIDPFFAQIIGSGDTILRSSRASSDGTKAGWLNWDMSTNAHSLVESLKVFPPVDVLMNLAGVTPQSTAIDLDGNTSLAMAALDGAAAARIPFVLLVSSAAVYGVPKANTSFKETDPVDPANAYGLSKLQMETAVLKRCAERRPHDPRVSILRIGNVAGADQLLLNAVKQTSDNPLILDRFPHGSSPQRSYIGPKTLAQVILSLSRAAISGRELPEILNIAAPRPVYMHHLLTAASTANEPINWVFKDAPSGAIESVCLDTQRLATFYDFRETDSDPAEMTYQWHTSRGIQ